MKRGQAGMPRRRQEPRTKRQDHTRSPAQGQPKKSPLSGLGGWFAAREPSIIYLRTGRWIADMPAPKSAPRSQRRNSGPPRKELAQWSLEWKADPGGELA